MSALEARDVERKKVKECCACRDGGCFGEQCEFFRQLCSEKKLFTWKLEKRPSSLVVS
jgi:hypothetical protein